MTELMNHAIVIGLSIAVVVSMISILNIVRMDSQQSIAQAAAENVCAQLKLAAEQFTNSSMTSTVRLTLPDKLGGELYSISAIGHTVNVTSSSVSYGCVVGTTAQMTGNAYGKTSVLSLSGGIITLGV